MKHGLSLLDVVFVVLLVLKLLSITTMSWWWVFSPLLLSVGLWLSIVIVIAAFKYS